MKIIIEAAPGEVQFQDGTNFSLDVQKLRLMVAGLKRDGLDKIRTIKAVRALTDWGLKEAKDFVDSVV